MPFVYLGGGALVGFVLGNGTENVSTAVKWAAGGLAVYVAAKHFKVI